MIADQEIDAACHTVASAIPTASLGDRIDAVLMVLSDRKLVSVPAVVAAIADRLKALS